MGAQLTTDSTTKAVRPLRVRIYYEITEKICEQGIYTRNGNEIPGCRNYYYNSGLWLTWKLPRSKKKLIQALDKWKWQLHQIDYDQSKMDLEYRHQDHYDDFDLEQNPIEYYDNFHGSESTIVSQIKNKSGPNEIKVFFSNGIEKEILITKRSGVVKKIERLLV